MKKFIFLAFSLPCFITSLQVTSKRYNIKSRFISCHTGTSGNIMGIKTTEIATKASFNKSIPKSKLPLQNYPVQTMGNMIQEQVEKHSSQGDKPNPQQMQQVQYMLKRTWWLIWMAVVFKMCIMMVILAIMIP